MRIESNSCVCVTRSSNTRGQYNNRWKLVGLLSACCFFPHAGVQIHHSGSNQINQISEGGVTVTLNTDETVCVHVFMFAAGCVLAEAAAKKGNNSINRILFLNTTAVVTVTVWHVRQRGGCVSSLVTKTPQGNPNGQQSPRLRFSFKKRSRQTHHEAETVAWIQPAKCTQGWLYGRQRTH